MSATLAEDIRNDEDNYLLTNSDISNALDAVQRELHFLRFFYNWMKVTMAEGGTDEVYWATEAYEEENGIEPPKPYFGGA